MNNELLTINGIDKLIGHTFRNATGSAALIVYDVGHVLTGINNDEEAYLIRLKTRSVTSHGPFYIFIYRQLHPIDTFDTKWMHKMKVKLDVLGKVYHAPLDVWFKDMDTFLFKLNDELLWIKY